MTLLYTARDVVHVSQVPRSEAARIDTTVYPAGRLLHSSTRSLQANLLKEGSRGDFADHETRRACQ